MNIKELWETELKYPGIKSKFMGLIGLIVIAFLCLGLLLGSMVVKEVTITEYITLPPEPPAVITTTTVIYRDAPAQEPIIVKETIIQEVDKIVLVRPHNFGSKDELSTFLANDDTDSRIIIKMDPNGSANLTGVYEDIAIQLQARAEDAGFRMSFQSVGTMELNSNEQWVLTGRGHAICSVIIGNECIFIEPSTDEYWVGAYLD